MTRWRAPKTTEQQFYTIYARHKADLGEPPDETDDVASTLARIGIPPSTYTHRAVYNTEQLNPKFGKFWMFLVGIRAEWDWDSGLEPPWWCSRHPDRNG